MRIAVGGFQHETNTFAPHRADYAAFERADSWPPLVRGAALFDAMAGLNLPLAGFIEAARGQARELLPLAWCSAEPSGYVTEDAFERIAALLLEELRGAAPVDAVYLDLHGAMVCEHHEDGEGELLRRVRDSVGTDTPIVISLDLHANVTAAMLANCDGMTIYRTYPHLDMAASGARAFELLRARCAARSWHKAMRKIPFLFALTAQCTDFEPCRSIYAALPGLEQANGVASIDFAAGFPPADIAECGAAVVACGAGAESVEAAADKVYRRVLAAEADFDFALLEPDEAVARALELSADKPVVLADAQDNPGAGATADSPALLDVMVRLGARRALLAMLYDPEVAQLAHAGGVGAVLDTRLGGNSGVPGVAPYAARFEVDALGDGRFVFTGAMNRNAHAELGPTALLRVIDDASEVRVIVGSTRAQCLDLAMIRHLGIEPASQAILAVKSSVHFRADFDPIAATTLVVAAPGANPCRFDDLRYRNLRAGVRLGPRGPAHGT